jgi:MSHA pilin protein MshC
MLPARASGFTLTELVLILVLIGILAVVVVPRLDIRGFERRAFATELVNALRYAQKTAMGTGCPVQATVDAADDRYSLSYTGAGGAACGSGPTPVRHPTRGGPFEGSGEIESGGAVVFDARGRTTAGLVIALADGSSVTVEAGSGYVHD